MHHFTYKDGRMYCEDVPLEKIAAEVGTPAYVYSRATLERHYRAFDEPLSGVDHIVCFSVKANSNISVLKLFAHMGSGFDIVSGGELYRVQKAGGDTSKVVYSGVGKTRREIKAALEADIMMFSIESFQELEEIDRVAGSMGKRAPVALRINPDVDPKTHPYITTGMQKNKFGIDISAAPDGYRAARAMSNVEPVGVTCHIGSQIAEIRPFVDSLERLRGLVKKLRDDGMDIRYLDLGGGLGITYDDEEPPHPEEYARALTSNARDLDLTLVFEPGRVIAGNAGILLTKTLYIKDTPKKHFIIVDAAMNDLIRPSLYGAYHEILPVKETGKPALKADVVGPICESGDFLARDRALPDFQPGDLMAVMSAGAYGFTMASNYNSRPRPPEVMVDGASYRIIRRRESYDDLARPEVEAE